jgi:hypothetical protein
MKKKNIYWIVTMFVFVTLMAISCNMEEDNPFKGTWKSSQGYTVTFSDSTWELPVYSGGVGLKGTYIYSDNTATITYTEISNDGIDWKPITSSEASGYVRTATVSGNKLTWGVTTYTKQ